MDPISKLESIGFTTYESKVYLALLAEYPSTGYQLSKKAGIPRSMVYEALGRLHARGAVLRTEEGRATLYRPIPPDTLLDRYEQEQHHLIDSLRESLRKRYNAIEEDHLWSLTGRSAITLYALGLIQTAGAELMLVINDADLATLLEQLVECNRRGASLHLLLTGSSSLEPKSFPQPGRVQVAHHPSLESELQKLTDLLVIVADGRKCLIGNVESTSAAGTEDEMTATVTNNRNLVYIVRQFVWMELFTQKLHGRLGHELIAQLSSADRKIFGNIFPLE